MNCVVCIYKRSCQYICFLVRAQREKIACDQCNRLGTEKSRVHSWFTALWGQKIGERNTQNVDFTHFFTLFSFLISCAMRINGIWQATKYCNIVWNESENLLHCFLCFFYEETLECLRFVTVCNNDNIKFHMVSSHNKIH